MKTMKINPIDPRGVNVIVPPAEARQKVIEEIMWDGIYVKLRPFEELNLLLTPKEIAWFGWKHGIYQFPTIELISKIKDYMRIENVLPSDCLEIGAGGGHIGKYLDIRMTDSRLQDDPTIQAYYQAVHQPILRYSPEVEKLDGNSAVIKYRPKIVIGCWVTEFPQLMFGVREPQMMEEIGSYFFVGNKVPHRLKPILNGSDGEYYPWIVSRSLYPLENRIWIVKGNG